MTGYPSDTLGLDLEPPMERMWKLIAGVDFRGWDPGTIYYSPRFRALLGRSEGRSGWLRRGIVYRAFQMAGHTGVRLLAAPHVRSTKAIALCAAAFAHLYRRSGDDRYRGRAEPLLDELRRLADPEEGVWRPDFVWWTRGERIAPDGGMCSINTTFATDAFWQWYLATGDQECGARVVRAALGVLESLPYAETEGGICFTYHPGVRYYVHNANLWIALLLARAGRLDPSLRRATESARRAVAYSVSEFGRVRAFPYSGPLTPNPTEDNYHTGYVLRALHQIRMLDLPGIAPDDIDAVLRFGVRHYVARFADPAGVYRFANRRLLQAHSLAEALAVFAEFADVDASCFDSAFRSGLRQTYHRLWDRRRGYFINQIYRLPLGLYRRDVTPMPRWAWAWMLYGLARLAEWEGTGQGEARSCGS